MMCLMNTVHDFNYPSLLMVSVCLWSVVMIAAGDECEVQEGDLHEVRHQAAAGVQHHHGGGAQGGVRAEVSQGVLPRLRVGSQLLMIGVNSCLFQTGWRHSLCYRVWEHSAACVWGTLQGDCAQACRGSCSYLCSSSSSAQTEETAESGWSRAVVETSQDSCCPASSSNTLPPGTTCSSRLQVWTS